jgi:hypothetical protein
LADQWDLSYRNRKGKLVKKKKLTTAQVRELLKDEDFDLKAQGKRGDQAGYRALAACVEFEAVMRGRIAKERADRKTTKFQDLYKKLEEEEVKRQRWKGFRRMYESAGGFVMFLLYLALVVGALVAAGFAVKYGMNWLGTRWDKPVSHHQRAPELARADINLCSSSSQSASSANV